VKLFFGSEGVQEEGKERGNYEGKKRGGKGEIKAVLKAKILFQLFPFFKGKKRKTEKKTKADKI
jgi:hypothetical protein